MDSSHNIPNDFTREELWLKPTDLGPFYRPPIKAYAYVMVINKKTPFVFPSDDELYLVSLSIYLHNKLQAIDVDKEVSKEINYFFYHAPKWQ